MGTEPAEHVIEVRVGLFQIGSAGPPVHRRTCSVLELHAVAGAETGDQGVGDLKRGAASFTTRFDAEEVWGSTWRCCWVRSPPQVRYLLAALGGAHGVRRGFRFLRGSGGSREATPAGQGLPKRWSLHYRIEKQRLLGGTCQVVTKPSGPDTGDA